MKNQALEAIRQSMCLILLSEILYLIYARGKF